MTLTFTLERHQGLIDAINGHRKRLPAAAAQPMVFGADLSHWQGTIDFGKVKAAGFTFVVLKATEGTGYVDPRFTEYRAQAHAAGLIVRMYHYVGSSTARRVFAVGDELAWFVNTVGPLAVGEGIDLDFEPAVPPPNPTAWARTWLDGAQQIGASPWIYLNSTTEARYDWTSAGIPARYGLWLAKYDNDPDMDPVVHWPALGAEQYWDRATVPGIAGPVDVDVFYGTTAQLLAGCKGGAPAPTPLEDDMAAVPQGEWDAVRDAVAQLTNAVFNGGPSMEGGLSLTKAIANVATDVWWNSTVITGTDADGKLVKVPVLQWLANVNAQAVASTAAVTALVQHMSTAEEADPVAIGKAVQDAVVAALAANTVNVDVHVAGPAPQA